METVYVIDDVQLNTMHIFKTSGLQMASKDAVTTFMQKNKTIFFTEKQNDSYEAMLSAIAETTTDAELHEVLVGYDFRFAMKQFLTN